jgi:hypothetical protein
MSDHTDLPPTVEQATTGLANISLDPDVSGHDTDSTGSLPDPVPASDSDNDPDESGHDVQIHLTTPVIRTDTRAVNDNTNPIQPMNIGVCLPIPMPYAASKMSLMPDTYISRVSTGPLLALAQLVSVLY